MNYWHWWYIPLLILAAGFRWAYIEGRNSQPGMFPDMAPFLIAITTIIIAGAVVLGHFI